MSFCRLCYVSQSTKVDHLVREDLMNIINEAVRFNAEHHIFGVLYYGNGYFFQCLEGEREAVENVYYDRILKDPRHQNLKILTLDDLEEIKFSTWNMKFAPYHQDIMGFMATQGTAQFDPYVLDDSNLIAFLDILCQTPELQAAD